MSSINNILTKTNADIQDMKDPDELVIQLRNGYFNCIDSMCGTLDYQGSIQLLARMTKKLAAERQEPQEAEKENIDIFEKIEKLSMDFILRLRKHEMEHTHVEERMAGVSKEQKAI